MRRLIVLVAATFLAAPAPSIAQELPTGAAAAAVSAGNRDDGDGGNPRLELLGLLGLAGLLGLLRRERHIHVDARRTKQD